MKLTEAFRIKSGQLVSLVGAGGKSTIMWALAKELKEHGEKVLVTTTTKIFTPNEAEVDGILLDGDGQYDQKLDYRMTKAGIFVLGTYKKNGKLHGISPERVCQLKTIQKITVLVEADGAARKPFKAPAPNEPVVPICSDVVAKVVGLDILNSRLGEENVHRLTLVKKITGLQVGELITPKEIAKVLLSEEGYGRKNINPAKARQVIVLNKMDKCKDKKKMLELADILKEARLFTLIVGTRFDNQGKLAEAISLK